MQFVASNLVLFLLIAGCGGGGSNSPSSSPMTAQSPGGHWFVQDANSNSVHLYISEAGEVRSVFHVAAVTDGSTFGTGSISIVGTDSINGVLQARGIQPSIGAPTPVDLSCSLAGTIRERKTLTIQIICSDSGGIVFDEPFAMTPQPDYDAGSSLNSIAGNYTLAFRPATNMLNITADGTLFGMYHNGANCTVNGVVSIIDADYSFLGVEWTMSSCIDPIGIYEGAVMTGFAMQSPSPIGPQGSYYFLLSGQNTQGLFAVSVTFEPT